MDLVALLGSAWPLVLNETAATGTEMPDRFNEFNEFPLTEMFNIYRVVFNSNVLNCFGVVFFLHKNWDCEEKKINQLN